MTVIENVSRMQDLCTQQRSQGEVLAFVPTMGALHEGHLALVRRAESLGSRVIVSIFVNPTQFAQGEDFEKYPRTIAEDIRKLSAHNVFATFHPSASQMYVPGFQTKIQAGARAQGLCGGSRPGHFDGVLVVVLKLLNIIQPHFLIMGKKDYQQLKVVQKMLIDFNLPIELVGIDTLRESNGLAMSSRNQYLSVDDRQKAGLIYEGLQIVKFAYHTGIIDPTELSRRYSEHLMKLDSAIIEYADFRTQKEFASIGGNLIEPSVFLTAVRYKNVRLIDNIELG